MEYFLFLIASAEVDLCLDLRQMSLSDGCRSCRGWSMEIKQTWSSMSGILTAISLLNMGLCHPVPAAAGQGPAWDFRSSAAFSGAAEVKEDAMLCLGGKSDLSAQSLVTEQCGWVSRAHSTADPTFPALQTPRIPLAAPALAARHGLWCSVRLEQGEKRDIFVMNGVVEILPMFFLPFLWFTY